MITWTLLGTAFALGILGVGHCATMCGATMLLARPTQSTIVVTRSTALPWAALHGGRIVGYTLLGAVAGSASALLVTHIAPLTMAGRALAALSALWIVWIGLTLCGWRLTWLRLSGPAWLPPAIASMVARKKYALSPLARFGAGVVWATLPCGLIYTALAAALTTGGALAGAAVMLAFGLGTLPFAALTATRFASRVKLGGIHGTNRFRALIGLAAVALGSLQFWMAVLHADTITRITNTAT